MAGLFGRSATAAWSAILTRIEVDSNYLFNRSGDITEIFIIRHPDNQYGISLPTVTKDGYFAISVACTLYCFDLKATLADGWTHAANSAYQLAGATPSPLYQRRFVCRGAKVWTGSMATQPLHDRAKPFPAPPREFIRLTGGISVSVYHSFDFSRR